MTFPWHAAQWSNVNSLLQAQQFPHALLVTGMRGLGKADFARELSIGLVCEKRDSATPCNECSACRWARANTHPDLFQVSLLDGKSEITVDQIRQLNEQLHLTGSGGFKVAILEHAELMNTNAANALLKTLEEPAGDSVLILVSDHADQLPATIRSRCHRLTFHCPDRKTAVEWLRSRNDEAVKLLPMASGAPLRALQLSEGEEGEQRLKLMQTFLTLPELRCNFIQLADQCSDLPVDVVIDMMQSIILDLMRCKVDEDPVTQENPDFHRAILELAGVQDVTLLLRWWDSLGEQRRIYHSSLNKRLFLENLFYLAQQIFQQGAASSLSH